MFQQLTLIQMAMVAVGLAALGIITVWTPQILERVGNLVAVPVTILGLGIALLIENPEGA